MFDLFTGATITADSATFNPAVGAQTIATAAPPEQFFDYLMVVAVISIEQSTTGAASTQNFDIIDSVGAVTLKTFPFKTYLNTAKFDVITLVAMVKKNTKGAINLSLRGSGVDAQTSIIVKQFFVAGVDQGRV